MLAKRVGMGMASAAIAIAALGFFARPISSPPQHDATHVTAVRAGGGDVPANLLRVYIELSGPMAPGSAYEHIHLMAADGREVKDAFLELREELWSPDYRRLTLLFDPGRVKRGIRANVEMGAPLVEGRRYRLVIDSAWRDARNVTLSGSYTQELRVAAIDSSSPDPLRWRVSAPRRNSLDTLRVDLGEALDHALALRLISVVDDRGSRLAGRAALSSDDRVWMFVPTMPWSAGAHLRIEPALEDLAGNNLVKPFDSGRLGGAERAVADTTPRFVAINVSS